MNRILPYYRILLIFSIPIFFAGCFKDKISKTYSISTPVIKSKSEVLADVASGEPKALQSPGKIYLYGNYLFVNDVNKGVHIIDNSDKKNPNKVAFINIPGNLDIAVRDNILYADMYTDLLTIDISDPLHVKLAKILPSVFPERNYGNTMTPVDSSQVIVDWITRDTTVDAETSPIALQCNCILNFASSAGSPTPAKSVPGLAGSMARLALVNNYMYTVNSYQLGVFNIQKADDPVFKRNLGLGGTIETIYPFANKLFIGSQNGMFMFNLDNPEEPTMDGAFSHATACDPVVADEKYAYVTLREGTRCMGTTNELDILDISNIHVPVLIKSYSLTNPHGLAIDGDLLFICDGSDGLKIYNTQDINDLKMVRQFPDIDAYDVIAWNNKLLLTGSDGIYQYDYSDRTNIKLLSMLHSDRNK